MRDTQQSALNAGPVNIFHNGASSDIKKIFIILVDISGYTRFITHHKISLLHAEKIIAQLMESILDQVEVPVIAHEILGDAISFYAIDEDTPEQGNKIYGQLQKYFDAFREREARLISECSLCKCDSCRQVGKLKLKAILHHGEAAFTSVHNTLKISGEDVIISHRLLKNSIPSKEYILMTQSFLKKTTSIDDSDLIPHYEAYEDVGSIELAVKIFDDVPLKPANLTFFQKLKGFLPVELHGFARSFFRKNNLVYKNLPY